MLLTDSDSQCAALLLLVCSCYYEEATVIFDMPFVETFFYNF